MPTPSTGDFTKQILTFILALTCATHGQEASTGDYIFRKKAERGYEAQVLTPENGTLLGWVGGTLANVTMTSGSGTVESVSVTAANGVSGSVATATTTPAITLTLGAITPSSVNGNTITTGTGTLTLAAGKTLTASNTLTLAGTDGSALNVGTGGTLGTAAYTAATAYAPSTGIAASAITGTAVTLSDVQTITGIKTFATSSFLSLASGSTFDVVNGAVFQYGGTAVHDHLIALGGDVAPTGTGAIVRAASPTITGTLTTAAISATTVTASGLVVSGTTATASGILGLGNDLKYTTGTVSRDNAGTGTTFTSDATMAGWSLAANTSYRIEYSILYDCGAGGIKTQFLTPSHDFIHGGNLGQYSMSGSAAVVLVTNATAIATGSRASATSGTGTIAALVGFFEFRTTASGTLDFQWAQNSSSAAATRVFAGSTVKVIKQF